MRDRIPTYPGRVKLEPVSGQANVYDMTRADEPTQEGTPLNKASLLQDDTAALLALEQDDPTVNDALYALAIGGLTTGTTIITVLDAEGNPVPGVAVTGLTDESGNAVTTGTNGKATVICTAETSATFASGYVDLASVTQTITPKTPGVNLVTVTMPFEEAGTVKLISASGDVKFRKARSVDLCLVGGGTGGKGGSGGEFVSGLGYSGGDGGSGGASGKVLTVSGVSVTKDVGTLAVGAGGAGGSGGTGSALGGGGSFGSSGGDTTFLSYSSASGSTDTLPFDTSGVGSKVGGAGGAGGSGSTGSTGGSGRSGVRGGGIGGSGGTHGTYNNTRGSSGGDGVNGGGGGGGGGGGSGSVQSGNNYGNGGNGGTGGDGCLMVRIL